VSWNDVGNWLKGNAGTGAALVGSLLTGNVPGAVAAGVALVSSATGTANPQEALERLQTIPSVQIRLAELQVQEQASIRAHLEAITALELSDRQHEHQQTQETIRHGDSAESALVRSTRPLQSWASLAAAILYIFMNDQPDGAVLMALFTLPCAYAGLRGVDKIVAMTGQVKMAKKVN
jgi:hypothetical protein